MRKVRELTSRPLVNGRYDGDEDCSLFKIAQNVQIRDV